MVMLKTPFQRRSRMTSIYHRLRTIKADLDGQFSANRIRQVFAAVGYRWRDRLLDPVTTIHVFLLQILHGNVACSALPHLANERFTASAYCQARARLPLSAMRTLVARPIAAMQNKVSSIQPWRGHRLFHVDGTSFSMPDTPPLQDHFGQPGGQRAGCGFPVAHLLALCHAGSGMVLDVVVSPWRTHDMSGTPRLHPQLRANDVLVADRAFCSYAHLALILLGKMHCVFRAHQRQIVDFRQGRSARRQVPKNQRKGKPTSTFVCRLGACDQVVQYVKPPTRPAWMTVEQFASLPETILVRELRYNISRQGFRAQAVTLVTTLLDSATYPKSELADVYHQRWQIEINFRHLKQTMGMDILRCKTVDGVLKELWMFVLAYNLVCMTIVKAACRQGVPPHRVSFIDALRSLRHAPPSQATCELAINPLRKHRIEPRVVKRRPKQYTLMQQPRDKLRKQLRMKRVTT
jgi:hypothetical protein